jgi:cytidyltransferase-like protein
MSREQFIVAGGFDDLRARDIRFLEEAARLGELRVCLWSDDLLQRLEGVRPKFPQAERQYLLEAIRFVQRVELVTKLEDENQLPETLSVRPGTWVVSEAQSSPAKEEFCRKQGLKYQVIAEAELHRFPTPEVAFTSNPGARKVIVTGCYDWFHSGHVRFFEEASAFGDLYVVVGHDANIRLLKGKGHPMLPQEQRRYMVGAVRYVTQALVSSGDGWLDAEPEMARIQPDIYAVNEDGDRGGKREFCAQHGIEYLVLKRRPAPGLPARTSTDLRGF